MSLSEPLSHIGGLTFLVGSTKWKAMYPSPVKMKLITIGQSELNSFVFYALYMVY